MLRSDFFWMLVVLDKDQTQVQQKLKHQDPKAQQKLEKRKPNPKKQFEKELAT